MNYSFQIKMNTQWIQTLHIKYVSRIFYSSSYACHFLLHHLQRGFLSFISSEIFRLFQLCNNLKQNQSNKAVGTEIISHFVTHCLTVNEYINGIFRPNCAHQILLNIQNTHYMSHTNLGLWIASYNVEVHTQILNADYCWEILLH
jgi:hypothetical protein